MAGFRVERDFLGAKNVPKDAFYGISTVRSGEIFGITGRKMPLELIYAIVQVKMACARANNDFGLLDAKKTSAIVRACNEILAKNFDGQFVLGLFQSGSGTATHMNVNEVIANRANEIIFANRSKKLVDAHDDVNKGQSTNDVFPTAIRISCMQLLQALDASLLGLERSLERKSKEFSKVLKSARTHLQDAVPMTLGQEFGAYARAMQKNRVRLHGQKIFLCELGIGGTAVGTGLNSFPGFGKKVVWHLNAQLKQKFVAAKNGVEAVQFLTDLAAVSASLKLLAVDLNKICFDLRLMNSGPKTGFGEISLPVVEAGSSIMPGKVNPAVCEAVNMACLQVIGNDVAVSAACANGVLELNTHMPLVAVNLIDSLKILDNSCRVLAMHAVKGIKANREKCGFFVEHSAALATALNPLLGYDAVAMLVKESLHKNVSVRDLAVQKGFISKEQAKKFLNPSSISKPNLHLFKKSEKK